MVQPDLIRYRLLNHIHSCIPKIAIKSISLMCHNHVMSITNSNCSFMYFDDLCLLQILDEMIILSRKSIESIKLKLIIYCQLFWCENEQSITLLNRPI